MAPSLGLDLDQRYPAEHAFWAKADGGRITGSSAPWMAELRAEMRADGSSLSPIPPQLHQTWKDSAPPRVLFSPRWSRSLREHNPGWSYRLWTDDENRALVASRYAELLGMYDAYESPIQRADVARYLVAHAHGGIYADLDTECFGPFAPLVRGASLLLSYKAGGNFSRGACNSIFGSAVAHPFWRVVIDVLRNRSLTPLSGHTAVLYSTGPAVLREAIRRLLRLPEAMTVTAPMMAMLRAQLGIVVLDASILHPVTAERRTEARAAVEARPAGAVCTHHFVSSWVAHDSTLHTATEQRRRGGDAIAAMHGEGQPVLRDNRWGAPTMSGKTPPDGASRGGGDGGKKPRAAPASKKTMAPSGHGRRVQGTGRRHRES